MDLRVRRSQSSAPSHVPLAVLPLTMKRNDDALSCRYNPGLVIQPWITDDFRWTIPVSCPRAPSGASTFPPGPLALAIGPQRSCRFGIGIYQDQQSTNITRTGNFRPSHSRRLNDAVSFEYLGEPCRRREATSELDKRPSSCNLTFLRNAGAYSAARRGMTALSPEQKQRPRQCARLSLRRPPAPRTIA